MVESRYGWDRGNGGGDYDIVGTEIAYTPLNLLCNYFTEKNQHLFK